MRTGGQASQKYVYDVAGNRTGRVAGGVEERYYYDKRNRLTAQEKNGVHTEFQYDAAGNLVKDDKAAYTYDAFNRNTRVETFDGNIQINRYDVEGLRHEMEENGKLVQFIFRGTEVVAEETQEKKIRYICTHEFLASDAESARTYYHYASDEMGSITHVTAGNEILNRYEYDAWGNAEVCEEQVVNRFRFNGQQYDPVSQQYYLRARFYNPVIARFTQEDTYRGDGLNLYAYCRNNPVYYVDPSGHICEPAAQRIMEKLASNQATRNEQKKLAAYLRNKINYGKTLSIAEETAARKLGISVWRTEVAQTECQKVVNVGNAIKAFSPNMVKDKNPVTSVFVHADGIVSVGISGSAEGNPASLAYAKSLQIALNESAGYQKYTVSATTDTELLERIPESVGEGNLPGVCAEPKAATAAHYNSSKVTGMDTRYYTPDNVPKKHQYNDSNQMLSCDTCKAYMEEYVRYANNE